MLAADGRNVKLGKGSMLLELYDQVTGLPSAGLRFLGNANSIGNTSDAAFVELYSSTQASAGLVAKNRTRLGFSITVSLNEYTVDNLTLFLLGTTTTIEQAVEADEAVILADVVRGRHYELGVRKITGVTGVQGATPLVLGVDYDVNSEFGLITIRRDSTVTTTDGDTDVTFTFDAPALTKTRIRIGTSGSQYARLVYLADDANSDGAGAHDKVELWKVEVSPDGELNFISDDYGAFNLTMAVISDGVNHPTEPYGHLDRVTAVA